jgi:peptide subunit release factor 1 (eRF1)
MSLFREQELSSERDLWERVRAEYLRGGLGVVGLPDVLGAAQEGRVEAVIVSRDYRPDGRRCRQCGALHPTALERCSSCGSTSLFPVDTVNEVVELLEKTGATVDFASPIPTLTASGNIAALLRY